MGEIYYNSRSGLDKLPFGAVAAGTKLRFGLRLADSLNAESVDLVFRKDDESEAVSFPLEPIWRERGFARFEGSAELTLSGLYWYHFEAVVNGEKRVIGRNRNNEACFAWGEPPCWQLTVYDSDYATPDWIVGGEIYHIFVDRFNKSGQLPLHEGARRREDWNGVPEFRPNAEGKILNNDFFGGNLQGVIDKLPYLQELGVTCIYLSPIFEAASNHKYDTGDYEKIDPSFGDEEVFSRLCEEAKAAGIRVICDGVFNHTGDDSRYFNRYGHYDELGAFQSEDSPYSGWYCFESWPEKYDAWWGIQTLPQLNESSTELKEYLFGESGVLNKWTKLGASGWRLDVADELEDGTLDAIRTRIKSTDPNALVLGEVWEDASNKISYGHRRRYLLGKQLDSVMNYPFKNAVIDYVLSGNAQALAQAVESTCENYPAPALRCMMNLLGTHDTPRILTVLSGEGFETREERANAKLSGEALERAKLRLHLASILQFTLPGVPCVYYGDEAGLEGYEDPFNRRCFPWGGEDEELLEWYKLLGKTRKGCEAFAGGEYKTIKANDGIFTFKRNKKRTCAIVSVNLSDHIYRPELPLGTDVLLAYNCGGGYILPGGCVILQYIE